MAQDRVSKTILQYTVDQASLNKAMQSADKVEGRIKTLATSADKVTTKTSASLGKLESVTQSISRALSGLGLGGAGQALGGVSDILQIKNATANAAEGSKLLSTGLIGLTAVSAATAAAIQQMNQNLEPTARLLTVGTAQLEAFFAAIAEGTTDSIQKQLDSVKAQKQAVDAQVAAIKTSLDNAFASEQQAFGGDLGARIKFALASTNPEFQKLGKRLEELQGQSSDLDGKMQGLGAALKSTGVAANDAKAALDKQIATAIATWDEVAKKQIQMAQTDRTATSDQVRQRLEAIEAEKKALTEQFGSLQQLGGGEQVEKEMDRVLKALQALDDEEQHLTKTTLALTEARERENRLIDVQQKYNADVQAIEQRSLEQRARIQDQYNQKIVDIARQAADAAANALAKLREQRADLARDLGRDLAKEERDAQTKVLDIRIQAQQEEAKALQDHYRNLEQIRKDAEAREADLILNRDFLALFMSRRQTGFDLERANRDFGADQQQRQQANLQQLDDLRRSIAQERSERLIAYQNALADAQTNYQREITQAAQAKQQQLTLAGQAYNADLTALRNATTAELTIRRQKMQEEIRVAGLTGQARIDYLNRERQIVLQQAQATAALTAVMSGSGGGAGRGPSRITATRDATGFLAAGQLAKIGVGGEAFNGIPLPGAGYFMPMVPGNVTKTNQYNATINFPGSTVGPQLIKATVVQAFKELARTG